MKYVTPILAATTLVTGLLFGLPMNGFGQDSKTEKPSDQNLKDQSKKTESPASVQVPVYTPPKRGATGGRVGGGTRGFQREVFLLSVLAPGGTVTGSAMPTARVENGRLTTVST